MSRFTEQWLEIFRAGDYGDKGRYSERDLATLAEEYDGAGGAAPVVIGHPGSHAPAVGWVEGLKQRGAVLLAKLRQVQPSVEQAIAEGRFKKRSVALLRDGQGKLRLRHLGLLGAMPPEIKGLADAQFSDASGRYVSIEYTDGNQVGRSTMKANLTPNIALDPASVVFAEAAQKRANARRISYGQALHELHELGFKVEADGSTRAAVHFNEGGGGIAVDPASVVFMEAARKRAVERHLEIGQAMTELQAEEFADTAGAGKILVAAADGGRIYLNAGAKAGLKVGDKLSVDRVTKEIPDPATGQVIRRVTTQIGVVKVAEVDNVSAIADVVSGSNFQTRDVATPIAE
jgi:hypothetical protein